MRTLSIIGTDDDASASGAIVQGSSVYAVRKRSLGEPMVSSNSRSGDSGVCPYSGISVAAKAPSKCPYAHSTSSQRPVDEKERPTMEPKATCPFISSATTTESSLDKLKLKMGCYEAIGGMVVGVHKDSTPWFYSVKLSTGAEIQTEGGR